MVEHKSKGYLADCKSLNDLMDGLFFVLSKTTYEMNKAAVNKVKANYLQSVGAGNYSKAYKI